MRLRHISVLMFVLISGSAYGSGKAKKAVKASAAPKSRSSYGMAGCGLGGQMIRTDEMFPQLVALTLNGISTNQSSGLTSGTSGCAEEPSDVADMEQSVYVTANLASLSREAAQGTGQQLGGLAEVFGCSGDHDKVRLKQLSHDKYEEIFADQNPDQVLERFRDEIRRDDILAKNCRKVS